MQVLEYLYYDFTLTVGVHTPRMQPTPATVFLAGTLHSELLGKVRNVLREYHITENLSTGLQAHLPAQGGFPLYGIRRLAPAGALRSVDDDFNLEITLQRFTGALAFYETTFQADPEKAFAVERVIEKAAYDLFVARAIPCRDIVIPGDDELTGETVIDIMCELGAATEQGDINVNA